MSPLSPSQASTEPTNTPPAEPTTPREETPDERDMYSTTTNTATSRRADTKPRRNMTRPRRERFLRRGRSRRRGRRSTLLIVTAGGEGIAPTSPLGLGGARVRLVGRDEPVRVSGSSTERDICARGDPPATLTDREVTLFILGTVEAGDDRLVEVGVFPRGGGLRARGKAALVGRKIGVGGESAGRNGWRCVRVGRPRCGGRLGATRSSGFNTAHGGGLGGRTGSSGRGMTRLGRAGRARRRVLGGRGSRGRLAVGRDDGDDGALNRGGNSTHLRRFHHSRRFGSGSWRARASNDGCRGGNDRGRGRPDPRNGPEGWVVRSAAWRRRRDSRECPRLRRLDTRPALLPS